MLWLQTSKDASGTMNLGGSLTKQVIYAPLLDARCLCDVFFFLDIHWLVLCGCLQCFDAVAWASGKASGL